LLDNSNIINEELINENISESDVFSFDVEIYKKLLEKNIQSNIADDYLNQNEREKLFDHVISLYNWYENNNIVKKFEFNGINLLSIMNPFELHFIILSAFIKISIIKKIIEQKSPVTIVTTNDLSTYVKEIINTKNISIKILSDKNIEHIKDQLNLKLNIGKIPISIKISRKKYSIIRSFYESILCKTLDLWHNDTTDKKTILLLEFNTENYEELMSSLGKTEKNIVLLNWRRSAIWNMNSIKILRKTNCKVLNPKKILTSKDFKNISDLNIEYSNKLDNLWKKEKLFNELFSVNGISIWNCIKEQIIDLYKKRIIDYIQFAYIGKNLFESLNVSNILALNEVGETERTILKINNNKIPTFLLKHDFSNYFLESEKMLWRYEGIRLIPFTSNKFMIWGNANNEYYTNNKIENNKLIITGSPRYDNFFRLHHVKKNKKVILITPEPITGFSGQNSTNLFLRYENVIKEIITIIRKIHDAKIIVKLHPGDDKHNEILNEIFKKIDTSIVVFHTNKTSKLIEECDILLNITCEIHDPSTIMLEGMIFEKPVIEITLDDKINRMNYQKELSILSLSDKADLNYFLVKIIQDKKFQNELVLNQKKHLGGFLSNRGNASKVITEILDS